MTTIVSHCSPDFDVCGNYSVDDRLSLFEPLWDSGVRRVGQAGARGWGVELQERLGQADTDREELVQTSSQQLEDDLIASKIAASVLAKCSPTRFRWSCWGERKSLVAAGDFPRPGILLPMEEQRARAGGSRQDRGLRHCPRLSRPLQLRGIQAEDFAVSPQNVGI